VQPGLRAVPETKDECANNRQTPRLCGWGTLDSNPELPFKFDEIGYWSELKLEIVEKYGAAYTTAFNRSPNLKKYYIDAFSGAGVHISKTTGTQVEGSPARALNVSPPFDGFYFIDLDEDKTDYLRSMYGGRRDVHIHTVDSNKYLVDEVLPKIQYKKFTRALCLLDPYALHLDWSVNLQAGQSKAVDMFLNFPVMDMNRNAIWRSPDKSSFPIRCPCAIETRPLSIICSWLRQRQLQKRSSRKFLQNTGSSLSLSDRPIHVPNKSSCSNPGLPFDAFRLAAEI